MKTYTFFRFKKTDDVLEGVLQHRLRVGTKEKFIEKGYKHLFDIEAKTKKDARRMANRKLLT